MKIFIVGSCVSRDAFEDRPHKFTLTNYVARSSFASSLGTEPFPLPREEFQSTPPSKWADRMAEWDFSKALPGLLRANAPDTDIVLVDLIDERFPVIENQGVLATYSSALTRPLAEVSEVRVLSGEERFSAWLAGIDAFAALVTDLSLPVVVNRAWWAETQENGEPFPKSKHANSELSRMYLAIDGRLNCLWIDYPQPLIVGASSHKWNPAPFHYVPGFYDHTIARLTEIGQKLGKIARAPVCSDNGLDT